MQPAIVVGLISIVTGTALQDDIEATAQALRRKGEDILSRNVTLNFQNGTKPSHDVAANCPKSESDFQTVGFIRSSRRRSPVLQSVEVLIIFYISTLMSSPSTTTL